MCKKPRKPHLNPEPSNGDESLAMDMLESLRSSLSTAAYITSNSLESIGNIDANRVCLADSYPARGTI